MSGFQAKTNEQLADLAAQFFDDPYGFVMAFFPWGEATLPDGSANPLKRKKGPEPWQKELLQAIGAHIRENSERASLDLDKLIWRSAIASGHGIGKSALVAWLIIFFMATRADTRGVVTASTQKQLEDKTWPELSKWHNLLLCKHWFRWTATSYVFALYPEDKQKNYMFTAMTVSEHNTEAFAGLHNENGTVVVLFDEASGVAGKVWEVAQGALTDGEGFFLAFGNPTQPEGEFADCFDLNAELYYTRHIDSRTVSHTNKQAIADMIRMYRHVGGEDSDEVKVRVRGMFPTQSFNGFISPSAVDECLERELFIDNGAALIMAVDVARFGSDETVIGWRQGRDARSRKYISYTGLSTVQTARLVMQFCAKEMPDAIVIESTGPGAGVIDILKNQGGYRVIEVHPGGAATRPDHYFNRRAEYWSLMRDAINENLCLYDDPVFYQQLTKIQYMLDRHEQRIKLEAKEDYKTRTGLSSPDRADTLALTFAATVLRRDANLTRLAVLGGEQSRSQTVMDYDVISY